MQATRFALLAALLVTSSGCHTTSSGRTRQTTTSNLTRDQLAEIFLDRRSKGAMVGVRSASATEYAVDFATPEPPITGTQYRYESFKIRKTALDAKLAADIGRVAIRPAGPGPGG